MKKTLLLATIFCIALSGCGKKNDDSVKEEDTSVQEDLWVGDSTESTEKNAAVSLLDGTKSPLTGETIDTAIAGQRPVSVMIGNTTDAMPQYGTSSADIIYEVPVEGGLTRLMALYQDYANLKNIMSVRSCRHYFAYFAEEFNSIYVHYGQASYATEMLEGVDDLNGLDGDLDKLTFFRDNSRKSPHNAFVNGESIVAGIQKRGYETALSDTYLGHYAFAQDNETIELTEGVDAAVVAPGFPVDKPWFEYNSEDGLYYRYQYKAAHVDGGNNEQLKFKNVIFQVCDYEVFPDGSYLDVKTTGSGAGKFITNGKAIDVTWTKDSEGTPAKYYDSEGNEIVLNQGKTFVCVVLNDATEKIGVYASKDEFEAAQ